MRKSNLRFISGRNFHHGHKPAANYESMQLGIYIGLGANLNSHFGSPKQTLEAALDRLELQGVIIVARSRWHQSVAIPDCKEPDYTNGVISVETTLTAKRLLSVLHDIEREFGRTRRKRWESRMIDLDLLDFRGMRQRAESEQSGLELPHPRLQERAFVLLPLRDIAPQWRHPVTGQSLDNLIAALPERGNAWPLRP